MPTRLLLLFLLALHLRAAAQELPPVTPYEADVYGAGNQNWMLSQDERGFIYAANNAGLLEFNGTQWHSYPSPNESILRSVQVIDGRIYTGSYMDFGFWERRGDGDLAYRSLTGGLQEQILPDEQFWNIIPFGDAVLFQSLQQFFLYRASSGETTRLRPAGGITKAFAVGDELYFTDTGHGLYTVEGGTTRTVLAPGSVPGAIVHAWVEGGELRLQTADRGTVALRGGMAVPLNEFPFLEDKQIYSATALRRGGHAFGTISSGVYLTDPEGRLRYHLDQVNGLTNNTVLSLFQDAQSNVWVGSDNGLNCINLASPIQKYTDRTGQLGTVYAAARHEGRLYLGSNQGLFVQQEGGALTQVPGTRGQVWSLFPYGEELFCGHDSGTFRVSGERAELVSSIPGTWTFQEVPGRPDLLLQGNYRGMSVLERGAGGWHLRNAVGGFDLSARYLVLRPGGKAYVSHEYRGVYGLQLDPDYRRVTEQKAYPTPAKGKNAGLVAFRDSVYYYSRQGLFTLQDFPSGFVREEALSAELPAAEYRSGRLTATNDRLWYFSQTGIGYLHEGALRAGLSQTAVPVAAGSINSPPGYENLTAVGKDTLLIGTADGYLTLARTAVPLQLHELYLTEATARSGPDTVRALPLDAGGDLPFDLRNLSFAVAVPDYSKYFRPRYQYRLRGLSDEWSDWTSESRFSFPALEFGDYTLEVRSELGRRGSENRVAYPFTILRPWYASYPAIALYLIAAVALIFLLHRSYTRYYRRKQRMWRLEKERTLAHQERQAELELTRLNNQRLREDVEAKGREAAQSTMSLVRKNELLQQIKSELLEKGQPEKTIQRVVRTIDRNLDEAGTWEAFKEAFENADQDFFKKIKERHPELTPNDLKLCAYLRLNLSSKEIAPMLNISPRSVEVKRYRLRKKMDLERETGLTEHIMAI